MRKNGFTLIELLLVLVIVTVAVTIVALTFSKLNSNQALDKSALSAISMLDEARSLTLSSVEANSYGIHLDSDQMVRFQGTSYNASSSANVILPLNQAVSIRNINLQGGGTNIIFNRLTGTTDEYGSFEIYLKSSSTTFRTVSVSSTGVAEEE